MAQKYLIRLPSARIVVFRALIQSGLLASRINTRIFEYDIEEWKPNRGELSVISYEDNKSLIQYFGKWENIQTKLPDIAEVIGTMAGKDHIMIAKMDSYVKDLIDK